MVTSTSWTLLSPVSHRAPSALRVPRIILCVTRSPFHRQATLVRASPATLPQSLQPVTPRSQQTTPRAWPHNRNRPSCCRVRPLAPNGHESIMVVTQLALHSSSSDGGCPLPPDPPSALRVSRITLCVIRSPFHRQATLVRASPASLPQSLQPVTSRSLRITPSTSPRRSVRLARHQGSGTPSSAPP